MPTVTVQNGGKYFLSFPPPKVGVAVDQEGLKYINIRLFWFLNHYLDISIFKALYGSLPEILGFQCDPYE